MGCLNVNILFLCSSSLAARWPSARTMPPPEPKPKEGQQQRKGGEDRGVSDRRKGGGRTFASSSLCLWISLPTSK